MFKNRKPEKLDVYFLGYSLLQGGSIMTGWTSDRRMMIACCNDGTRPAIFKIAKQLRSPQ